MANGPRSEIEAIFQVKGRDPLSEAFDQIGTTLEQSFAIRREQQQVKVERQQRLEDLTRQAELQRELLTLKDRNIFLKETRQNEREDKRRQETDARLDIQFKEQQRKASVAEQQRQQQLDQQRQKAEKAPKISASRFEAATFANRIAQAEQIFSNLIAAGFDPTTTGTRVQRALPEAFKSQLIKQQEQAERNFVNAVLRRESGAAIAPSEFDSAEKQYFPRVGDSDKVLEQKKQNRAIVLQGLQAEARGILPQLLQAPKSVKEAQKGLEEKVGQIRGQTAPGQSRLSPDKQRRKEELLRKRGVR